MAESDEVAAGVIGTMLKKHFSWDNLFVLLVGDGIGLSLCIAAGDAALKKDWGPMFAGFGVGLPLMTIASSFPFWKNRVGKTLRDSAVYMASAGLGVILLLAVTYVLGPYVFARQSQSPIESKASSADDIAAAVIRAFPKTPATATADEIADAVSRKLPQRPPQSSAATDAQLAQLTKERDDLKRQNETLLKTGGTQLPKSKWLRLDDLRRWQIQKAMVNGIPNGVGCNVTLNYDLTTPDHKTAEIWGEIQEPLFYAGWRFLQDNNRTFLSPGIAIFAGTEKGTVPFICATRLKELLDGLDVGPTSFHPSESNPDLLACKNDCINVSLGKLETP